MPRRVVAVLAVALGACSGDEPQVPTTLVPSGVSSLQVTGGVASQAGNPPQVQIRDAKGKGIKGLRVLWKVGPNSGSVVNDSTVTDAAGVALSGGWKLGVLAGTQTLRAIVDGVAPLTFTAQVAPGPAANLVRLSQDEMQAVVNTNVPIAPSVSVQDTYGNVIPGLTVTFAVLTGGGTITGAQQVSDQNGVATADGWQLGTVSGLQVARATSPNVNTATWTATALADAPADLLKVVGDNQQSLFGAAVSIAPGVRVVDAFNNPIGQVPVTFTPAAGSGTVTLGTVATDPATGAAFVGSWVLGSAESQSLVATSSALPGKPVTFSATAMSTDFDVDIRFIGEGGTPQVRQAFIDAATKWRRVIVGHVHSVMINRPAGACLPWAPAISETVNDVVIFARIGPIDGAGRILAQAGPCTYSTVNFLPITGIMEFDEADVPGMLANGTFRDVVLHEMGHVLGVGTLWNVGRSFLVDAGSAAPYFTGAGARAAFAAINTLTFSGDAVPVEGNLYPVGTRDGHWRTSVFGSELMQGFAKIGGMPLSRVTAASVQDLGYEVNFGGIDPFSIASPILQGFPNSAVPAIPFNDELASPMYGVDRNGKVVTVIPRRQR